jgi:hypothetical protein
MKRPPQAHACEGQVIWATDGTSRTLRMDLRIGEIVSVSACFGNQWFCCRFDIRWQRPPLALTDRRPRDGQRRGVPSPSRSGRCASLLPWWHPISWVVLHSGQVAVCPNAARCALVGNPTLRLSDLPAFSDKRNRSIDDARWSKVSTCRASLNLTTLPLLPAADLLLQCRGAHHPIPVHSTDSHG